MKKIALALGIMLVTMALPLQAIAGAPTKDVTTDPHVRADWQYPDLVGGIQVLPDDYLVGYVESTNRDADGNVTGYTSIFFDANMSPYGSLQVAKNLETATLNLHGVPAGVGQYDANHEPIFEGSGVPIDIQVTWTGVGAVSRTPTIINFVSEMGGCSIHVRAFGPSRNAVATGTIGGVALSDSSSGFLDGNTSIIKSWC